MAYCTVSQVRDVVSGVTSSEMSDTDIGYKIAYAESIINSYISWRYTIPFTTVPPLITTICIDIAAYYVLRTLFTRDSVNRNDFIDDFILRHLDTKTKTGTLYDIYNGDISLINSDGTTPSASISMINSNTEDYIPTFDVDDELNWTIDNNRLNDIANERD
jgi:phage gp36-like protein